jgi:hypothetical protein
VFFPGSTTIRSPHSTFPFSGGSIPAAKRLFPLLLAMVLLPRSGMSQTLNGMTGLIRIPTAEVADDGMILFGCSLLDRKYNEYWPGKYHQTGFFFTMGFAPRLEVSLRITRSYQAPKRTHGLGDRMASFRLKLIDERGHRPAVALGVYDVLSALESTQAIRHNALYLAGSKRWTGRDFPLCLGTHVGYGADWMQARRHEFTGPFGGISLEHRSGCALLAEYDSERVNAGLRLRLFGRVQVLVSLIGLRSFAGVVSCRLNLDP